MPNDYISKIAPIIEAFRSQARPVMLRYFSQDSCVAATRICIDVMQHFGIKARAQAVSVVAHNAGMIAKMRELGRRPKDLDEIMEWEKENGAWNLVIGGTTSEDLIDPTYVGHVVAIIEEQVLIDIALDQANRPQRGMIFYPYAGIIDDAFLSGEAAHVFDAGSLVLSYNIENHKCYTRGRQWHDKRDTRPATEEIISLVKMAIQE